KATKPVGVDTARASGPSSRTRGSGSISLAKVMPSSTSPRANILIDSQPVGALTSLGLIAAAMPSFSTVDQKLTPQAAPRSTLGQAMERAAISVRVNPSCVATSALGASAATAATTLTVASGVSLSRRTWPELVTASKGGCTTGTSTTSPAAIFALVAAPAMKLAATLWPLAASKRG